MIRSGDEPAHARSPLGLRLGLAGSGLLFALAWSTWFAITGPHLLAWAFAVVAGLAVIDLLVVISQKRQGAHYQPGPDVPPYRPVEPPPKPRSAPLRVSRARRLHRYLALMGLCLGLLLVAWVWVRLFSTGLAVALTLAAMVIPPIAAIVANIGAGTGEDR